MLSSLLLGSCVGLISSILGLGGGIIIVPLLPLFTDLSRKESVFVSLCSILIIVSANTYSFYRENKVDVKAVLRFGPLTAIGSVIAVLFISPYLSDQHIKHILSAVLLIWGVFNLFKVMKFKESGSSNHVQKKFGSYLALSLLAGVLSGLLGIGSGLILSLMLVSIPWMKSDKISPTSNGIMIFTTLFASLTYYFKYNTDQVIINVQEYTLPIAFGALITAYFGRKIQHKLARRHRGIILVSLLLVLSVKTFIAES